MAFSPLFSHLREIEELVEHFARSARKAGAGDAVTLVDVLSGRAERLDGVDAVVVRTHGVPEDARCAALRGLVPHLERVGDAVAVRPVDRAVFEGHLAGRAV